MWFALQSPENGRVNCDGVVIACSGDKHSDESQDFFHGDRRRFRTCQPRSRVPKMVRLNTLGSGIG